MPDWAVLNRSFIQHPPVDLLAAAHWQFVSPSDGKAKNVRQSRSVNSEFLKSVPPAALGRMKKLHQMPDFIRNPKMMEIIEKMKLEAAG